MAPKFGHKGEKERFIRRQTSKRKDHQHGEKLEDKSHKMSLTRKLMLGTELLGLEGTVNFEQIYLVPCLQTLGMPLSLTYLTGLVAGLSGVFLLPSAGWLVDRGSNPQRRKNAALIVGAGVLVTGVLCLAIGNILHLQHLLDYNIHKKSASNASFSPITYASSHPDTDIFVSNATIPYNTTGLEESYTYPSTTSELMSPTTAMLYNHSLNASEGLTFAADISSNVENTGNSVPFKAGLAMLGFILLDMGYDITNCFIKTFLVSCSPRAEHTSLFVLALIMSSLGGVLTTVLGLVDFTSLFGLNYIEGVSLTVQICVQAVVVIIIVAMGLLITLTTGQRQLRHMNEHKTNTDKYNNAIIPKADDVLTRSSTIDAFENSIRSFRGQGLYFDAHLSHVEDNDHPSSMTDDAPLLSQEEDVDEDIGMAQLLSASVSYGAAESVLTSEKLTSSPIEEEEEKVGYQDKEQPYQSGCVQNPKVKIMFVCLATFFSSGLTLLVTYSVSDFLGKAVYKGDPYAAPGSDSLIRYQEGAKMASWAYLVYYITYLLASIVHSRILAFLGYRVEFVLIHVLCVATALIVVMTIRLEAVFVMIIVAGYYRTCYFSIPYAVTNDIAQSLEKTEGDGSRVALALSLVSACLPLNYCVIFSWVGAVEDMVGDPSVPLYLASAFGCLSVVAFLCVGKV